MASPDIYTVLSGPFWIAQEIHERGMVEKNLLIPDFEKRTEPTEVNADITIFQT